MTPLVSRTIEALRAGEFGSYDPDGETGDMQARYVHKATVVDGQRVYKDRETAEKHNGSHWHYLLFLRNITVPEGKLAIGTNCECLSRSCRTGTEIWSFGGKAYRMCKHSLALTATINELAEKLQSEFAPLAEMWRAQTNSLWVEDSEWQEMLRDVERNRRRRERQREKRSAKSVAV